MKQYYLTEGLFFCQKEKNNCFSIVGYEGDTGELLIPMQIEGIPVISIGKKAFLRNRHLQHVVLPDSIEQIGDWAFSGCLLLRKVTMPKKAITFGSHIFQKTDSLCEISFAGNDAFPGSLMAAAVTDLQAEYLLDPVAAGSAGWYRNLDARILTMIREPEDSVLKDLVYCAEEDMGAKQERCLKEQVRKKVEIAFLRMLYKDNITDDMSAELKNFLQSRTIGCADASAWEVMKERFDSRKAYCDILLEIGGIHEDNFQAALENLGENDIELKAYLLKKWQIRRQGCGLWEQLEL